jgi:endonuclease/exonuclease/phosphatase family metal-dependent hydrolase
MSYLSPFLQPDEYYIFALAGMFSQFSLLLNLLFIPLWLILKVRYTVLSLLVILVGLPFNLRQVAINFSPKEQPAGSIKIMSYNVQLFGLYNWKKNKEIRNEIFEFLKREDPDIICFQEYFYEEKNSFKTTDSLLQILSATNSHFEAASSLYNTHHWGAATFSRYPIVGKGKVKFGTSRGNICIYTDVKIGTDTLRVVNVHFESNRVDNKTISKLTESDSTSTEAAGLIFENLRKSYVKRVPQVSQVKEVIKNSPHKIVLCGDFNDVPVSYTYSTTKGDLRDAFIETGKGFGATFANKFSIFRIDYTFFNSGIKINSYKTIRKELSDHYPVVVTFSL